MRAWQVRFGEPPELVERPDPDPPGPGMVLLRMLGWSLNYRDLLMARGAYDPRLAQPYVPLSDGVGEVVAVGAGVSRVSVGDRVCPMFSPSWRDGEPDTDALRKTRGGPVPGLLAERVVLDEGELVKVPGWLEPAEAATLPCAALTAWSALVEHARLPPGATVLCLGTGGVSIAALQLAKVMGLTVIATTSSEGKAARLTELGADRVLRHDLQPEWGREIRKLTGGGVDAVVEVGGAATLPRSLEAVRPNGAVLVIGNAASSEGPVSVLPILMKQIRVQGVFVGHRRSFEELCRAVDLHRIRPVIDRVFPFTDAPDAFAHLASRAHVGKVCIVA